MMNTAKRSTPLGVILPILFAAAGGRCLAGNCIADVNNDGFVNSADFNIVFLSYGNTGPGLTADIDGDEIVGQSDLAIESAFFGSDGGECQNIAGPGGGAIIATRVDTSSVRQGDDPSQPQYDGGDSHFCFEISTDVFGDDRWTMSAIHVTIDPGAPFDLFHYPPPFGAVTVRDGFSNFAPAIIFATAVRSVYGEGNTSYFDDSAVTDMDEFFVDPWFTKFASEHIGGLIARIGLVRTGSANDPAIVPQGTCPTANHIGTVVITTTYASTEGQIFTNTYDIIETPNTADINGDLAVDTADLGTLIGKFGSDHPYSDLNNDGVVDTADLGVLISAFGQGCAPE